MSDETQQKSEEQAGPQFNIQRVYTKDISFETPNSPEIFQAEWKPEVKLDLDSRSAKLAENTFEVILALTVTVKVGDKVAYLAEVQQAGIFTIANMDDAQLGHAIGAFCPTTLFPYARETIANLVNRGSFPQLNLAPVNFDALYASYVQQNAAQAPASSETH